MEQKTERTRTYSGNEPGTGWGCVDVFNSDGKIWYLYCKDEVKDGWENFKLVARNPVTVKANYWFGWDGKKANNARDWYLLQAGRPELHATVLKYLTESA
jgi:hypothetical protein